MKETSRLSSRTLKFSDIHAELVALLQDSLAALLDKCVEPGSELGHAVAQVVEAKVDVWQGVCDRGANRRHALAAEACGK